MLGSIQVVEKMRNKSAAYSMATLFLWYVRDSDLNRIKRTKGHECKMPNEKLMTHLRILFFLGFSRVCSLNKDAGSSGGMEQRRTIVYDNLDTYR